MRSHTQPPLQTRTEGGGAAAWAGLTGSASALRPLPTAPGAGSSRPSREAKCAVPGAGARAVSAEPAWARLAEAGVRGVWWAT